MNSLFEQINQYQTSITEIRAQFSKKYFDNQELLEQIEKQEREIMEILSSLEHERNRMALRAHIQKNKISPHPSRDIIEINVQKFKFEEDKEIKENIYKTLFTQNCRIQIQIKPNKIHPYFMAKSNERLKKHKIPLCNLKLVMFYADKVSQTQNFKFTPTLNIHTDKIYSNKIGILKIIHQMTFSCFALMKQILSEHKIYIFLQNQFKLIIAMCIINLYQLIHNDMSNANKCMTNMLKFVQIGTGREVFILQCQTSVQKLLISPQIFQLKQKIPSKRVVSKSPNRSRSPSPTLHKHKANSVMKTKQIVTRIVVFHNKLLKLNVYKIEHKYDEFDENITIVQTENIGQNRIQTINQNSHIFLCILLKLKDTDTQGFVELRLNKQIYKITIRPNKLFRILTPQQSKMLIKDERDCKSIHAIISLTDNIYIRPNMQLKIYNNPIEQKITQYAMPLYYIKNEQGINEFCIEPAELNRVIQGEKGKLLEFMIDGQWMPNQKQLKIVFAGKNNYQLQNKNKEEQNLRLSNKNQLRKTNNAANSSNSIEIHVVKYVLSPIECSATLILQVKDPGNYDIQIGSLTKNSRYKARSCNQVLLQVIKAEFDEPPNAFLPVQLLQSVQIQASVLLILNDLTKHTTTAIQIILRQHDFWNRKHL